LLGALPVLTDAKYNMASNGSYSNERPSSGGDVPEYATDPASGGFFHSDYKKWVFLDDIKVVGTGDTKVALLFNPLTYMVLLLHFWQMGKRCWGDTVSLGGKV
jgi:hypothetical protein